MIDATDHPVHRYAFDVCRGDIEAGEEVTAACERHLDDLSRGEIWFDEAAANRSISFFPDMLKMRKGKSHGRPFDLLPWLQFCTGSLFGWKRSDTGFRRFHQAYIEVGKGAAKSPWGAGVGVYMAFCDGEPAAECYVMARTRHQASVAFQYAVYQVEHCPVLAPPIVRKTGGEITPWNLSLHDSFLRLVATEHKGLGTSGPSPHFVLADELHEFDERHQLDLYIAGQKDRRQPLVLMITNSGSDTTSPCGVEHEYAAKVAKREVEDDGYFAYVCSVGKNDDYWQDESVWVKTNPSLPATPGYDYIRKQVRKATGMPSYRSTVERLAFCRWVEAEDPWFDRDVWIACERDEGDLPDIRGAPCYLGLDLSSKSDFTALAAVWDLGEVVVGKVWTWLPDYQIAAREERDGAPYKAWADAGFLTLIPGGSIDYGWIARAIARVRVEHDVRGCAYDPHRMDLLEAALDAEGIVYTREEGGPGLPLAGHSQGFLPGDTRVRVEDDQPDRERRIKLYMPRSVDAMEDAVFNKRLLVARNPVLRWCALRTVIIADDKLNRSISKRKANSKTDAMVALVMANGYADSEHIEVDEYRTEDYAS